ncbi:aminotransferase class I/II-fold pyridoxal phosphate-dependent enzyme, partial [Rhizobium ruizarguesonis]
SGAWERVKDSCNSYPLDRLAQLAATAASKDEAWFETCRRKIIASRESRGSELEALGFEVFPSQANFVFARHESRSGA